MSRSFLVVADTTPLKKGFNQLPVPGALRSALSPDQPPIFSDSRKTSAAAHLLLSHHVPRPLPAQSTTRARAKSDVGGTRCDPTTSLASSRLS
jgi:hypothetical protein